MAADSAVTIGARHNRGRERVWKTTNKLFSLSPENDIAIMIYGTGDFCGVPWETIIKLFAQQKNVRFSTVEKCKDEFLDFVRSFSIRDPEIEQINSYLLLIGVVEDVASKGLGSASKTDAKKKISKYISKFSDNLDEDPVWYEGDDFQEFSSKYSGIILEVFRDGVEFTPSKALCDRVERLCWKIFCRMYSSGFETGIVFGGFGSDEYFPCMSSVIVDGKSEFGLRSWGLQRAIEMDTWIDSSAYIRPFAQGDIAHLFIEGIDEGYLEFMNTTILGALRKKTQDVIKSYVSEEDKLVEENKQERENIAALESIMNDFRDLRRKSIVDPMLSVVKNLPKEDMAAMAESLVEITSLRRKMDSDVESVAGPVDVVVISKGDGLIWMKRKHYFDMENNSDFSQRRKARRRND